MISSEKLTKNQRNQCNIQEFQSTWTFTVILLHNLKNVVMKNVEKHNFHKKILPKNSKTIEITQQTTKNHEKFNQKYPKRVPN